MFELNRRCLQFILLGCFACLHFPLSANWQPVAESKLTTTLAPFIYPQSSGFFVQHKYFKFLSKPVESSGSFELDMAENGFVIWQTTRPAFSELKITPENVLQKKSADAEYQLLTSDQALSTMIFALLSGRLAELDNVSWFDNQSGCVRTELGQSSLASLLSAVEMCRIEATAKIEMTILDKHSNKTVIQISSEL